MLGTIKSLHTPPLGVMLDDLGRPNPGDIAQALGVSRATVYRWIREDKAPRPVLLSLFWLTRWGRSQLECEAVNDARMAAQLARAHQRLADERLRSISHLLTVGDFGSANAPLAAAA